MSKIKSVISLILIGAMLLGDGMLLNTKAVSDNDARNVSGNDFADEPEKEEASVSGNEGQTVSANNLESVSGNALQEEEGLSEEARAALREIASRRQIMALLYLTDSYEVKKEADCSSASVVTINSGQTVLIQDAELQDLILWYQVSLELDGQRYEGYIEQSLLAYSDEELIAWEDKYLPGDMALMMSPQTKEIMTLNAAGSGYADIDQFPASYWEGLTALKKKYPKWTFVKLATELDWNSVVDAQHGERSYIWYTAPENYREGQVEGNWYYASKEGISYYLDPRKHFNEKEMFQFELLTYNLAYHTKAAVQTVLNGSFMEGSIPGTGTNYAQAFFELGNKYQISPFHLAGRVIQEQGRAGTSPMISGTYAGYEGYYNHFNVGATGKTNAEVIQNGLSYAKKAGWNTRYKSLDGGAATVGNKYVKIGQNTLYLQKFQVIRTSTGHALYTHQYMQNIQAANSEALTTYKTYSNAGSVSSSFVFRIPVYSNMPSEIKRVEISEARHELNVWVGKEQTKKESFTLTAKAFDTNEAERPEYPVSWSTSNSKVATVEDGVVTAEGSGTATITAKAGGKSAKCVVTVYAPLTGIELDREKAELYRGEVLKLEARYTPANTTDSTDLVWKSSNEKVAAVKNGLVTGVGSGTADITVTIGPGENSHTSQVCKITVKACTVTFYKEDGSVWQSDESDYGVKLTNFPDETKITGHETDVFSGWYTRKDGKGIRCTEETVIREDMNLYPYWISTEQDFFVKAVGDQIYTGAAIKPEVFVYDGKVPLVLNQDYTVTYSNNKVVAGEDAKKPPTITVKGKGNYSGTQKIYFNICPKNINDSDIVAEDLIYAYTGKVIKPSPVLYRNGKKLIKNTDYKVSYPWLEEKLAGANLSPGTFPVKITGCTNYTGERTVYLTITKRTLMSKVTVTGLTAQEYNDGQKVVPPNLVVKYGKKILTEGTDYSLEFPDSYEVGTASILIHAAEGSDYMGTKAVKYKITGIAMSKVKVLGIQAQTYTGIPIELDKDHFPDFEIYYQKNKNSERYDLQINKDYTVTYGKNNAKTGTGAITFTGMGKYTGTLKKTFKIAAYNIAENAQGRIRLETDDLGEQGYVRGGVKPDVSLHFTDESGGEVKLERNVDYTLSYKNYTAVNDGSNEAKRPMITIKGKGKYSGTLKNAVTFTIGPKDMGAQESKITAVASDIPYKDGKTDYKPKVVVKDEGRTLKAGKDYTLEYNSTNVTSGDGSVYTATIRGLEKEEGLTEYYGSMQVSYRIYSCAAGNIQILAVPSQVYEEEAAKSKEGICPKITAVYKIRSAAEAELFTGLGYEKYDVKSNTSLGIADAETVFLKKGDRVLLKEGRDYEFKTDSYTKNTKVGTAKVTIYGMNLFSGKKAASYKIAKRPLVAQQ